MGKDLLFKVTNDWAKKAYVDKSKYEKNCINAGEKVFYLEYLRLAAVSSIA